MIYMFFSFNEGHITIHNDYYYEINLYNENNYFRVFCNLIADKSSSFLNVLNCSNRLCCHSITCQRKSCDAEYKRLQNIFFRVSRGATYYERDKMKVLTCGMHNNLIQFILLNGLLSKQCKKKCFCSFMLCAYAMIEYFYSVANRIVLKKTSTCIVFQNN